MNKQWRAFESSSKIFNQKNLKAFLTKHFDLPLKFGQKRLDPLNFPLLFLSPPGTHKKTHVVTRFYHTAPVLPSFHQSVVVRSPDQFLLNVLNSLSIFT